MNSFPDPLTTPFNDEMHHRDIDELSLSNLSDNSSTTSNDHDLDSATFFEGPEKTLEVQFTPTTPTTLGLRSLSRKILDKICLRARCTIISKVSNAYLDAYVLSESSLFIYPFMLVLKTCGTTTLLRCVKTLLQFACNPKTCEGNLVVEWVGYSRKNFSFPELQLKTGPHTSFQAELEYIARHEHLSRSLKGNGYTLGPVTGDHWFVFVADRTQRSNFVATDRVVNIMMFDIDPELAKNFYYNQYLDEDEAHTNNDIDNDNDNDTDLVRDKIIGSKMLKKGKLGELCPGAIIDPMAFQPCGFSMNAILYKSYSTIHVTPEADSSYASFETNQPLGSYGSLINNVVRTFRPRRFVLTLMADEGGVQLMQDNPLAPVHSKKRSEIVIKSREGDGAGVISYSRKSLASIQVEDDTVCMMGNFELKGGGGEWGEKEKEKLKQKGGEEGSGGNDFDRGGGVGGGGDDANTRTRPIKMRPSLSIG
ncbi:hypothetical protein ScalyP_jg3856 [Parmales sp. scaly parma]|nr:hypothetical protein ScalyP_jg3856 [Parmales sp. scaly parma]